jgi:uncharacterized protein (UPF0264 family)
LSRLLVSVRDVAEAETAIAGGADLIDIKEPANGSLGRSDTFVMASIIRAVADRAPVSAAGGELELGPLLPTGLMFAKFGLAGWAERDWQSTLMRVDLPAGCRPVAVAYADWRSCGAPSAQQIAAFAIENHVGAFLIDTFAKDGRTLLDHVPTATIADLTGRCQAAGIPVALAGSLGMKEIEQLRDVWPDWFAVRGAACKGGRVNSVSEVKVRELKALLRD